MRVIVFSEKAKTREMINNLNNKRNNSTSAASATVTSAAENQAKKVKRELQNEVVM